MISPLSRNCSYAACPSSVSWSVTGSGVGAWAKHAAENSASSGTMQNPDVEKRNVGIIVSFNKDRAQYYVFICVSSGSEWVVGEKYSHQTIRSTATVGTEMYMPAMPPT